MLCKNAPSLSYLKERESQGVDLAMANRDPSAWRSSLYSHIFLGTPLLPEPSLLTFYIMLCSQTLHLFSGDSDNNIILAT